MYGFHTKLSKYAISSLVVVSNAEGLLNRASFNGYYYSKTRRVVEQ